MLNWCHLKSVQTDVVTLMCVSSETQLGSLDRETVYSTHFFLIQTLLFSDHSSLLFWPWMVWLGLVVWSRCAQRASCHSKAAATSVLIRCWWLDRSTLLYDSGTQKVTRKQINHYFHVQCEHKSSSPHGDEGFNKTVWVWMYSKG